MSVYTIPSKLTRWTVREVHGTPDSITMTIQTTSMPVDPELLVEMLKGAVDVFLRPEEDTSPLLDELIRVRNTFSAAYAEAFGSAR